MFKEIIGVFLLIKKTKCVVNVASIKFWIGRIIGNRIEARQWIVARHLSRYNPLSCVGERQREKRMGERQEYVREKERKREMRERDRSERKGERKGGLEKD